MDVFFIQAIGLAGGLVVGLVLYGTYLGISKLVRRKRVTCTCGRPNDQV